MGTVTLTLDQLDQLAESYQTLATAYRTASRPPAAVDETMPSTISRSITVIRDGLDWYGIDDPDTPAMIWGERPADASSDNEGNTIALITDNMIVRNLKIRDCGQCFRVSANRDGFQIYDIDAKNIYRLVEGDAGVSLTNFEVRNCRVIGLERSIVRLRGSSGPGIIKGCYADALSVSGDAFPVGIHFDETVHDILVEDCVMKNFTMPSVEGVYRQGDGFSDEGSVTNITYRNCYASGCTDGGWDIKSLNVTLDNCVVDNCKRNFRFWGAGTATHITSINPTSSHIAFHGDYDPPKVDMTIDMLVIRSDNTNPIFYVDAKGSCHIEAYDVEVPTGTVTRVTAVSGFVITWGPQGPMPDVWP